MTIVATAKPAPYVDPSALMKLYIREPESAAMNAWRRRHPLALTVTHHGSAEITNAIGLAAFRQQITFQAWSDTIASFKGQSKVRLVTVGVKRKRKLVIMIAH